MADAANDLEEHGMVRTLKDLFAGAAGGIAQVLLGKFCFPAYLFGIVVQSSSHCFQFDITCIKRGGWGS